MPERAPEEFINDQPQLPLTGLEEDVLPPTSQDIVEQPSVEDGAAVYVGALDDRRKKDDEAFELLQAKQALSKGELPTGVKRDFNKGRDLQITELSDQVNAQLEAYDRVKSEARNASKARQAKLREKRTALLEGKVRDELHRVGSEVEQQTLDEESAKIEANVASKMEQASTNLPGAGSLALYYARKEAEGDAKRIAKEARSEAENERRQVIEENGGALAIEKIKAQEAKEAFKKRIGVPSRAEADQQASTEGGRTASTSEVLPDIKQPADMSYGEWLKLSLAEKRALGGSATDAAKDEAKTEYDMLTLDQLVEDLAYSELKEDEEEIALLGEALQKKIDARVKELTEHGSLEQVKEFLDDIETKKNEWKRTYLDTNGHEISEEVRGAFLASQEEQEPATGEASEYEKQLARYTEIYYRLHQGEVEPGSKEADQLVAELRELSAIVYPRQASDAIAARDAALSEGNLEALVAQIRRARQELESYLSIQGIDADSDEARALRKNLHDALVSGETDGLLKVPEAGSAHEEEDTEEDNTAPAPKQEGDASTAPKKKRLRDRWEALRKRFKVKDGQVEKGQKRHTFRKYAGAAALVGAGIVAGFLLDSDNEKVTLPEVPAATTTIVETPQAPLPAYIEQKIAQDEALQEAGIEDEAMRQYVIDNLDDFRRMIDNPEQFANMVKWHEDRTAELMTQNPDMSRDDAMKQAQKEFSVFVAKQALQQDS